MGCTQTCPRPASVLALGLLFAALAWGDGPTITPADRWPMFRGNLQMTGNSACKLPDQPKLLWKLDTKDSIEATAVILDGEVAVPTNMGVVKLINLNTGSPIWESKEIEDDAIKCAPLITADHVLVGTQAGRLVALNRKSGKKDWQFETTDQINSSPIPVGESVLFGSYDTSLYSLNAKTGKLDWKIETGGPIHGSVSMINDHAVVVGCDGVMRLVDTKSAKEARSLEIGGRIASTPANTGKQLVLGTLGSQVIGIDLATVKPVWTFEDPNRRFEYHASPAVDSELAVIGGRDKFRPRDQPGDGKERWKYNCGARVDSSPVITGNRIWVGHGGKKVICLGRDTGKLVWEFKTEDEVLASPALATASSSSAIWLASSTASASERQQGFDVVTF